MMNNVEGMVSVIVPIYNAENYIVKCIESIVSQTYSNLEIILINDGSTDESLEVCKRYAEKDARIVVVSKPNEGLSKTRNKGISVATGKYITFVDADDYLSCEILECAVAEAEREKSDVVCWNCKVVQEKGIVEEPEMSVLLMQKEDLFASVVADKTSSVPVGRYFRAAWGKLYLRSILEENKVYFEEVYCAEDAVFLLKLFQYCKRINIINSYGYYYRVVNNSITHKYKADYLEANFVQMRYVIKAAEEWRLSDNRKAKASIQTFAWGVFNKLIENAWHGYKLGVLSYKELFSDGIKWFEMNKMVLLTVQEGVKQPKGTLIHMRMPCKNNAMAHVLMTLIYLSYRTIKKVSQKRN